jgi:hypothetical protein
VKGDTPVRLDNAVLDEVRGNLEKTVIDLPRASRQAIDDVLDAARQTPQSVRARFPDLAGTADGWPSTVLNNFAHYASYARDASLSLADGLPSTHDVSEATRKHFWPTLVWLVTGVDLHEKRRRRILGRRHYRNARRRIRQQAAHDARHEDDFDIT